MVAFDVMFERFRRDLARFVAMEFGPKTPLSTRVRLVIFAPQLQAIAVYRFGHWVTTKVKGRPLRLPLTVLYHAADYLTQAVWAMHVEPGADIGGGLYLAHPGSLLIGPVKMGEDCCVGINVIIGGRTDGQGTSDKPTIGDRVWIGSGSVLYGKIAIGSGASVGPLTAVGRNVAPRSLVFGSPMKVIRADYDNTHQIYGQAGPLKSRDPIGGEGRPRTSDERPSAEEILP